ncbi:hypothetical protein OsI_21657 [Oryza sativa Indica Group]|uniref:Uncharacterized protein n=1 Tax=Oryza sativa subsp. indica TaxID=39946 RepID=B8B2P7_ORYSI|nr:hypothetical protein OsI_21657 [Oryza sativa Indica Group]
MLKTTTTPPHPLAGEKVPLTAFDRAAFDVFVPLVFAYRAPAPSSEAVKEGLRVAVAAYPLAAGRLAVDVAVDGQGAPAPSSCPARQRRGRAGPRCHRRGRPGRRARRQRRHRPVQLTRFRCGGLVVGLIGHHHVFDGHSMSTFCATWARAVRDGEAFIVPSPSLDRAITGVPRSPPAPVFDHRSIEFKVGNKSSDSSGAAAAAVDMPMEKITNIGVHFTAKFVAELKARVGGRCSTFECVLAHAWKKITAARGLKPEEFTRVRVAVNCRRRANPPAPADLFGNMVLWAFPRLQVRRLLSSSYRDVVGAIRAAVARVDAEYIQSFVDYVEAADARGEELAATAPEPGETLCPDLEVDSWLGFRFHEMDLGTGPPAAVLSPNLPVEGLMILVPASGGGGGVDLLVALADDHAQAFEQICYSLEEHAMIHSHL